MLNGKSFLAVIPARGGSKRLPHKNSLPLGGKPLIEWSIESAKQSRYIDSIVVSSDDTQLLDLAIGCGVAAQQRPGYLATDTASSADCVAYVLDSVTEAYDYVVLLQPTSPLRNSLDIDNSIERMVELGAASVVSVTETEHSPLWSNTLPKDGSLADFISPKISRTRSQDLPTYYRLNGAVYVVDAALFSQNQLFIQQPAYAYVMPRERSVDIDTQLDLIYAESVFQYQTTVGL